jgi:hypothetical protein
MSVFLSTFEIKTLNLCLFVFLLFSPHLKFKPLTLCLSVCLFSAEQASRASVMGAFLRPESAVSAGASGNGGIAGRRGSDPRRPSALEQQVQQQLLNTIMHTKAQVQFRVIKVLGF